MKIFESPYLKGLLYGLAMGLSFPPLSLWFLGSLAFVFLGVDLFKSQTRSFYFKLMFSFMLSCHLVGSYWLSYTFHEFGGLSYFASVPLVLLLFVLMSVCSGLSGYLWGFFKEKYLVSLKLWKMALVLFVFFVIWDSVDTRLFYWSPIHMFGANKYLLASVYYLQSFGWRLLFFTWVVLMTYFFYKNISKKYLVSLLVSILFLAFPGFLGWQAIRNLKIEFPNKQKVVLLQGNVGNYDKKLSHLGIYPTSKNVFNIHKRLMKNAMQRLQSEGFQSEALFVWPETAYPGVIEGVMDNRYKELRTHFKEWVVKTNGVHIVGAFEKNPFKWAHREALVNFNTISLFSSLGKLQDIYRKQLRMPFGEYIPGDNLWPDVYDWIPQVPHFGRGREFKLLKLEKSTQHQAHFLPLICYEVLQKSFILKFYNKALSEGVKRSQILIVNPSNDSWYGKSNEPWIHSLVARWQTTSLGLPVLRPTNTGFSQIIAPWGEVLHQSDWFSEEIIVGEVPVGYRNL